MDTHHRITKALLACCTHTDIMLNNGGLGLIITVNAVGRTQTQRARVGLDFFFFFARSGIQFLNGVGTSQKFGDAV